MGKVKRVRQKLHQTSIKSEINHEVNKLQVESVFHLAGKSPLLKTPEELALVVPDNLFEGIDINFDNLNKKLIEDDKVSVRSILKSCKYDTNGKLLKKKEKQKLKHDLFMRKINTTQQLKKEALQKHIKRKALRKSDLQEEHVIHHSPLGMEITSHNEPTDTSIDVFTQEPRKSKLKGIKKTKLRQQEMLEGVSAFRKILADAKFIKDPCAEITKCVQSRIVKERK